MAYKISGTLSDDANIYVIDEASDTLEKHQVSSAGAYEVLELTDGSKIAIAMAADGRVIGYGNVTPEYYWAFEPSGSPYSWFDVTSEVGYSDNDTVGTFTDKIGSHNLTQSSESLKPLYKENIKNGLPILRFDGSNDKLFNTGFGSMTTPATYFVVAKLYTTSGHVFTGNSDTTRHNFGAGPTFVMYAGGYVTSPSIDTNWHVFTCRFNGGSSFLRIDGSQVATGSLATWTHQGMHMGAYWNGGGACQMDIGEFVVYNSSEDYTDNESGLMTKWGI